MERVLVINLDKKLERRFQGLEPIKFDNISSSNIKTFFDAFKMYTKIFIVGFAEMVSESVERIDNFNIGDFVDEDTMIPMDSLDVEHEEQSEDFGSIKYELEYLDNKNSLQYILSFLIDLPMDNVKDENFGVFKDKTRMILNEEELIRVKKFFDVDDNGLLQITNEPLVINTSIRYNSLKEAIGNDFYTFNLVWLD